MNRQKMTEINLNKKIGQNIKKYRLIYNIDNQRLTQQELAKKIGVSTSLIGSIESNKTNQGISVYNLYKISKVLKVPIENLLQN